MEALGDSKWYLLSDDILDTSNGNKGKSSLFNNSNLGVLSILIFDHVFVGFTSFVLLQVLVGKDDGSKGLLGEA